MRARSWRMASSSAIGFTRPSSCSRASVELGAPRRLPLLLADIALGLQRLEKCADQRTAFLHREREGFPEQFLDRHMGSMAYRSLRKKSVAFASTPSP